MARRHLNRLASEHDVDRWLVLVLTRDPVAARIGSVVVAALTRTERGVVSELALQAAAGC